MLSNSLRSPWPRASGTTQKSRTDECDEKTRGCGQGSAIGAASTASSLLAWDSKHFSVQILTTGQLPGTVFFLDLCQLPEGNC